MTDWPAERGWVEVTRREYDDARDLDRDRVTQVIDQAARYWVREEPVPPLPTEQYTVIRGTWRNGEECVIWLSSGTGLGAFWRDVEGRPVVTQGITAFEVLAEPWSTERGDRIAKATRLNTLDRMRQLLEQQYQTRQLPAYVEKALIAAYREFAAAT